MRKGAGGHRRGGKGAIVTTMDAPFRKGAVGRKAKRATKRAAGSGRRSGR